MAVNRNTVFSGVKNALTNAANKPKTNTNTNNSSNFTKTLNQYQNSGRLSSNNSNNLNDITNAVSRAARDAAAIRAEEKRIADIDRQNALSAQINENRQARAEQARRDTDARAQQQSQQRGGFFSRPETEAFNARQRENAQRQADRDFQMRLMEQSMRRPPQPISAPMPALQNSGTPKFIHNEFSRAAMVEASADKAAQRMTESQSRIQREASEQRLQSQREGVDGQSRLQKEGADQRLQSQREATDGQSRLQREGSDQRLQSQRDSIDGQSRLQRERTEQTSKLQAQAAAEAAARSAGNRAAAIEAFRKFGKGKAA